MKLRAQRDLLEKIAQVGLDIAVLEAAPGSMTQAERDKRKQALLVLDGRLEDFSRELTTRLSLTSSTIAVIVPTFRDEAFPGDVREFSILYLSAVKIPKELRQELGHSKSTDNVIVQINLLT